MNSNLSFEDQLKSLENIKEFHKSLNANDYNFIVKALVLDEDGEEIRYFDYMDITIGTNSNYYSISVNWEKHGLDNFIELNLRGTYGSTFSRISYQERRLVISDPNSDKKVILY